VGEKSELENKSPFEKTRELSLMNADLTNLSNKPTGYYESYRKDMLKYIPQGTKTTLEFGCGCGGFSALLKEKFGAESWAVEIERAAAEEAAKKLDRVINADANESLNDIPENYFDCIILFDILELEGIHPTSSRTFKLLNMILLNSLFDVRYKHFVTVVRPKLQSK